MECLTAAERAELEGYLREARAARHKIALGGGVRVFVDQNGERVEYSGTNLLALNKYINGLELKLGLQTGGPAYPWMV